MLPRYVHIHTITLTVHKNMLITLVPHCNLFQDGDKYTIKHTIIPNRKPAPQLKTQNQSPNSKWIYIYLCNERVIKFKDIAGGQHINEDRGPTPLFSSAVTHGQRS